MDVADSDSLSAAVPEGVQGAGGDRCRLAELQSPPLAVDHKVERSVNHFEGLFRRRMNVRRRGHRSDGKREVHADELAAAVCRGRRHLIDAAVRHLEAITGLGHRSATSHRSLTHELRDLFCSGAIDR